MFESPPLTELKVCHQVDGRLYAITAHIYFLLALNFSFSMRRHAWDVVSNLHEAERSVRGAKDDSILQKFPLRLGQLWIDRPTQLVVSIASRRGTTTH